MEALETAIPNNVTKIKRNKKRIKRRPDCHTTPKLYAVK